MKCVPIEQTGYAHSCDVQFLSASCSLPMRMSFTLMFCAFEMVLHNSRPVFGSVVSK